MNNKDTSIILISRLSWKESSLESLALNDGGFASRFNETELIIDVGNSLISYSFLRSTIPLKYSKYKK